LEKDGAKNMEVKPALALPGGLEVTEIEVIDGVLTITVFQHRNLLAVRSAAPLPHMCIVGTLARSPTSHAEASASISWFWCGNTFAR
jgi:hypothetical protein